MKAQQANNQAQRQQPGAVVTRVRQWLPIGLVLLLCAVPPIFVSHPIGYIPLVTFIILLLLCWAYLKALATRFTIEVAQDGQSATRGAAHAVSLVLKNRSKLPAYSATARITCIGPLGTRCKTTSISAAVDAMDDQIISINIPMAHVGVYTVEVQEVLVGDPMGLLSRTVECDRTLSAASTPREVGASGLDLMQLMSHQSHKPIRTVINDDIDYAGVRDYEYGDPLKSIHWKLSARTEGLLTRLFETSVNTSTSIVMDFYAPTYDDEALMCCTDGIVESALAAARLAQGKNMEHRICYCSKDGRDIVVQTPSTAELETFTKTLPCAAPSIDENLAAEATARQITGQSTCDNVILCASALSRPMLVQLNDALAHRKNVIAVLTAPQDAARTFYDHNRKLIQELESAGASCVVISNSGDLEVGSNAAN